jgi:hypothetical protein
MRYLGLALIGLILAGCGVVTERVPANHSEWFRRPDNELKEDYITTKDILVWGSDPSVKTLVGHVTIYEVTPEDSFTAQEMYWIYDVKWRARGFVTHFGHTYQFDNDQHPDKIGVYELPKGALRILDMNLAGQNIDLVAGKRDYTRDLWHERGIEPGQ